MPDALEACTAIEARRPSVASSALPPGDLVWPPPRADLDAVAVFTLHNGVIGAPDGAAITAPPPATRAFRRPLMVAAGLLAAAVVAWSELGFDPRATPSPTTAAVTHAPVATVPATTAEAEPVRPLSGPAALPHARVTESPTQAARAPTAAPADLGAAASAPPAARPPTLVSPDVAPASATSSAAQAHAPEPPVERLAGPSLAGRVAFEPVRMDAPAPPPQPPTPERVLARAEPAETPVLAGTTARAPVPPADVPRIHAVLRQYASAYRRLDAAAAAAVWPSLDTRALARAFDGLQSQQLVFDGCDVALDGARAQAACHGSATYVPRVGDRSPRTAARHWNFQLERVDNEHWRILTASIR